ncbi:hypothetical protein SUDANB120_01056 [Streptomyces sp. enrichment culture]
MRPGERPVPDLINQGGDPMIDSLETVSLLGGAVCQPVRGRLWRALPAL